MKSTFTSIIFLCGISFVWSQKDVGTSPLEFNGDKYYQHHSSIILNSNTNKSLYPACGSNFYFYDTLSLPFVDDFSQNHYMGYYQWDWPSPVDSIARVYQLIPDTTLVPLKYRTTPTYHYTHGLLTDSTSLDSVLSVPRQLITYGNCENPFVPSDTQIIYAITSYRFYWDTLTLSIDSSSIFPDGILTGDTIDTISVYYPLANKANWIDNFTYRNNTMGIDPPTYGMATFDGTNEFGEAYNPGAASSYGIADYLTSKPIFLGGLTPGDSVYLSFFHQPKGNGYRPAEGDSLVLEFYSPITGQWHYAWSTIGDTLTGDTVRPFLQEMIPVIDPNYFANGFQFRFKNWGNLSGNLDHWNIDYVRLDSNRTFNDTILEDVAFVHLPPTILNNYTSMPWHQFLQADVKTKWNNDLSNLFNLDKTITYGFDFRDTMGTLLNQYTTDYTIGMPITNTITPYNPNGYSTYPVWSEPDFNFDFTAVDPTLPFDDTTRFTISHYFNCTTTDVNRENDSIVLRQDFVNYYSYDDGTAEQALWLGTPGYMMVKFNANFADTLRAIQFYFSPIKENTASRYITLQVYTGDLNNLVHSESRQVGITFDPNGAIIPINNGYTTFVLNDAVAIPTGDFYVGWYQNSTFKLNVGFDVNLDNSNKTYYRTSSVWDTLSITGTAMIRPVVGNAFTADQIGIEEYWNESSINIYPNPTSHILNFTNKDDIEISSIRIMDITGKLISQNNNINSNQIDVSTFSNGIYFIQFVSPHSAQPVIKKFIVAR